MKKMDKIRQVALILLLSCAGIFHGLQKLSLSYIFHESEFWCSPRSANLPPGEKLPEGLQIEDQCQMKENLSSTGMNITIVPCDGWDYDRDVHPETAVSQFHLVCAQKFWIFLSQSIYLSGYVVGSLVSGIIADKFGRRPTIIIFAVLLLLSGIAAFFSPCIIVFNIFRWVTATSSISLYIVTYTYCIEISGLRWKNLISILYEVTSSVGFMLVPLLSWTFPRWTTLQLIVSVPVFIILPLCSPKILPESPRWLLANGHSSEGKTAITQESSRNKSSSSVSMKDLFRTPGLLRSTLVLAYIWCVFEIIYNFVIMNAKNIIPGNPTINVVIMSSLGLISGFMSIPIVLRVGRRLSAGLCLIITGSCFLISYGLQNLLLDQIFAQIFVQIGQFVNTVCLILMYIFTAEIYPTVIRSMGHGTVNACGRLGAMLPPLLLPYMEDGKMFLMLGVMALIAGCLVWLLPETKDMELMDSLEEGEEFNKLFGGFRCFDRQQSGSQQHWWDRNLSNQHQQEKKEDTPI